MVAMVHNLARLLSDLWNKIKQDSSVPIPTISENDIVVFVVGPTGSGKSWFVKEATKGEFVKSSRGYHPFTTKVQAIRCELIDEAKTDLRKEEGIVFIDTPSVLTGCDDIGKQREIKTWIDRTEHKPRYLGMIYMHRIETDPAHELIQKHLQEFTGISRLSDRHPLRVHIVISYDKTSGSISDSKITKHKSGLRAQIDSLNSKTNLAWRLSMHNVHFQGEPEVAWGAVEELLKTGRADHGGLP